MISKWKNIIYIAIITLQIAFLCGCKNTPSGDVSIEVPSIQTEEESLLCDIDEYKVKYDKNNGKFIIQDSSEKILSSVVCPCFWEKEEYNIENSTNLIFDKDIGVLEVTIYDNEKDCGVDFYFKIDENDSICFIDLEYFDYFRLTPYYGKKVFVDEMLSEQNFLNQIVAILYRYNMDICSNEYKVIYEQYEDKYIDLFYNSRNEKYYVFFADNTDSAEGYELYYSISNMENSSQEQLISDPFVFEASDGTTGEDKVDNWEEYIEYQGDNVISYKTRGECNSKVSLLPLYSDGDLVELLSFEYSYNEKGELFKWVKKQNHVLWGMNSCVREYVCDENGRCSKANITKTSGEENIYYLYVDNGNTPEYLVDYNKFNNYLCIFNYEPDVSDCFE